MIRGSADSTLDLAENQETDTQQTCTEDQSQIRIDSKEIPSLAHQKTKGINTFNCGLNASRNDLFLRLVLLYKVLLLLCSMVAGSGFEPELLEVKSSGLPLPYPAIFT